MKLFIVLVSIHSPCILVVSEISKFPELKNTCVGFCKEEVVPSPKSHSQESG